MVIPAVILWSYLQPVVVPPTCGRTSNGRYGYLLTESRVRVRQAGKLVEDEVVEQDEHAETAEECHDSGRDIEVGAHVTYVT